MAQQKDRNELISFQTVLDKKRETEKAVKVLTGSYYPKSLVKVEVLREEMRPAYYQGPKVLAQHVTITMPRWLNER